VDFLNLTKDGNAVILVFDRNAVANHYKMFGTSQGTQTVGDEYEEVIVAPRGSMPIRGTLKGFYFNPKRTAEIQEYQDIPWFQELLNSPYYMGPKQGVAEGPFVQRIVHPDKINIYVRVGKKPKLVATNVSYNLLDKYIDKVVDKYPQFKPTDFSFQSTDEKVIAEATGFIPVDSTLAHDPRYVSGLTVDIKPGETQRQAKKLGWTIDDNGSPPLLMAKLQKQLKEIKAK
jgi:hypothetical protein